MFYKKLFLENIFLNIGYFWYSTSKSILKHSYPFKHSSTKIVLMSDVEFEAFFFVRIIFHVLEKNSILKDDIKC